MHPLTSAAWQIHSSSKGQSSSLLSHRGRHNLQCGIRTQTIIIVKYGHLALIVNLKTVTVIITESESIAYPHEYCIPQTLFPSE